MAGGAGRVQGGRHRTWTSGKRCCVREEIGIAATLGVVWYGMSVGCKLR
jgi:hypothetical protein